MDSIKRWLIYALLILGFFVYSDFLINVGLNSTYKPIERLDQNSSISVYQQEATRVNGRIRGIIDKTNINEKYLKFSLYSERNVLMGQHYIDINQDEDTNTQSFELLFKANNVSSYRIDVVDEKENIDTKLEILPKDLNKTQIFVLTLFTYMIFW